MVFVLLLLLLYKSSGENTLANPIHNFLGGCGFSLIFFEVKSKRVGRLFALIAQIVYCLLYLMDAFIKAQVKCAIKRYQ